MVLERSNARASDMIQWSDRAMNIRRREVSIGINMRLPSHRARGLPRRRCSQRRIGIPIYAENLDSPNQRAGQRERNYEGDPEL